MEAVLVIVLRRWCYLAGVLLGLWLGITAARRRAQAGEMREHAAGDRRKGRSRRACAQERKRLARAPGSNCRNEQEKYAQMKADLDAAFGRRSRRAAREHAIFLALAKQELGGQTQEAKQTLEAKELAIRNMLDPLGDALKSLDEQTRAMEMKRDPAPIPR